MGAIHHPSPLQRFNTPSLRGPRSARSEEIQLPWIRRGSFQRRWEWEFESEPLRQSLTGFRREAFKVIVNESPDTPGFGQVSLDLECPTFECGFPFPKQFSVTMHMAALSVVLGGVIAKQTQVKKIGCSWKELEWREIAFVQPTGISPNPANPMFFQEMNDLGTMPARVSKLDRKTEAVRKLFEKFPKSPSTVFWQERRWQLNKNDVKFRFEDFHRAKEFLQLSAAIAQTSHVRDLAGQLASKPKRGGREFCPSPNCFFGRGPVEGGIDFHRRKVMRIKLEPTVGWQIGRVKIPLPFLKTPGTSAEADLLLCRKIQWAVGRITESARMGTVIF